MKRLALLLCFVATACADPGPQASTPPGPTIYRPVNGGALLACKPVGFDTLCRGG